MKKSLQLLLVKPFKLLPPPFFNKILVLIAFCCAIQQLYAQNPADFLSAPTYIGGYHIKCYGQSTGTINANPSFGTAPYTFLWNTSETTAQVNNKPAGVYILTVTDSLNVSYSDTLELIQPNVLNYQSTLSNYHGYNIEKHGHNNGSIQLAGNGGTPPYNYLWSNNDNNAARTGLTAGNYSFSITDANQCSSNGNITLTEPYPVQFSFTNVQSTQCNDGADGAATINISGGLGEFSVVWSNGSFSLSPNDLPAGYNEVRILEQGIGIIDTGITINAPAPLEIDLTLSQFANGYNVSCIDCFNGSITTTVTGGTAPYTYLWDDENSSTTANLSSLNGGKYNVNIIDAHGCEMSSGAILRMPIAKDWSRYGNSNIDTTEFIGSTSGNAVVFKTNNQEAMRLMGNGNVELAGDLKLKNLASNSIGVLGLDIYGTLKPLTGTQISETVYKSLPCPTINTDGSVDSPPGWTALALGQKYFNGLNTCGKVGVNMPSGIAPSAELEVRGSGLIKNNLTVEQDFSLWGNTHTNGNSIIDGKLGIGISSPNQKLEVNGNGLISGTLGIGDVTPAAALHIKDGTANSLIIENTITPNKLKIESAAGVSKFINSGSMNIYLNSEQNTNDNSSNFIIAKNASYAGQTGGIELFKILNDGTGYIKDLWIKAPGTNGVFPDYVFAKDYKLRSLAEVKAYYQKHQHLPDLPSAKQIEAQGGVSMSDLLIKLTKIVEENTIYLTQQDEQLKQLQAENLQLKKSIEKLTKK